ncbi:MAG: glycoside hydrolase family 88 protein [Dysgonamonadaceae bacterium]|jgi:rhamnogalacturonyl hydrolase YesR|nr:glycoside hydrolase family 88 protein [Dysgonamonadaceae bacterium]
MKQCIGILAGVFLLLSCTAREEGLSDFPPGAMPEAIGEKVCRNLLARGHMLHRNQWIHYAEVCTWYGALKYAEAVQDTSLCIRLKERFEPLFSVEKQHLPPPTHVDWNMFGSLPLELYRLTGEPRYFDLGMAYADAQWAVPDTASAAEKEWAQQGLSWQTRLWIDDMFMITLLQSQACQATGNRVYIDRAAQEMAVYLDRLQRRDGLFFHSPDAPLYWARGNGWMAAGMTELLRYLPDDHPGRRRILDGYRLMMNRLLLFQRENGLWNQLIDAPEFWTETSGSAMFTYALITGVKRGWLEKKTFEPAARKAWLALTSFINAEGELSGVCVGTNANNDRAYYYDRPRTTGDFHGQAPLLWCVSALLETTSVE